MPYSVAIGLFGIIMLIGPVSGGHVNPAVSTAVLVREGMSNLGSNIVFYLMIVAAQIFGAGVGVAITFGLGGKFDDKDALGPRTNKLCPGGVDDCRASGDIDFSALMAEMLGTFIFCSVILSVKYNNGAQALPLNAFAISITLFNVIQQTKNFSGAAINPAVGIVQTVYQQMVFKGWEKDVSLESIWIYIVGPLVGGALAGFFSLANSAA